MSPLFLNVDLDIESTSKLDSLASAMGKKVNVLHSGPGLERRYKLVLEVTGAHEGPDATIHALCAIVEGVPPGARRTWNASRRVFDVGYEIRESERLSHFSLRPDTLERIARLGAFLAVTTYRGTSEKTQTSRVPSSVARG